MRLNPSWVLVFGFITGGILATNCGSKPVCTQSTCNGCCDAKGACISIGTNQACGRGGEACKACGLSESCAFGSCMSSNPTGTGGGFVTNGGSAGGMTGGGSAGGFTGGGSAGGVTGGGTAGGFTGGGTAGGAGSCNSATCSNGCCSAGQCRTFPGNATASSCGFGGQNCAVCPSGWSCNQTTFICQSTGGGSAGGGGGGGGGSAGGPSAYTQQTITAACESMATATTLLDANTATPIADDVSTMTFIVPGFGNFFGMPVNYASVQSNGMVSVHSASTGLISREYVNSTIPDPADPNGFAAPLWDDLYTNMTATSAVKVLTVASPAHYTIGWIDPLGPNTEFQAKFFQTGVIEFHYCNLGTASLSATVGLENSTGTSGVTWTGSPMTGSGVRFTP